MTIINLTPIEFQFRREDGIVSIVPPSGQVARIAVQEGRIGTLDGLPIYTLKILDLPDPVPGTIYIASLAVALAAVNLGRIDVYALQVGLGADD